MKKKYTTYNKYNGKWRQQSTNDKELAVGRVDNGGYAVLNLRTGKDFIIKDKRKRN
jgi:hypothetical protein